MPPNPWTLIKFDELNCQQRSDLRAKFRKRKDNLTKAMNALEQAITLLSRSLDEDGKAKYSRKIRQKRTGR